MKQYGIFGDEGLVEDGFYRQEDAEAALLERYSEEDELHVGVICHDHPEHEEICCEECNQEEE